MLKLQERLRKHVVLKLMKRGSDGFCRFLSHQLTRPCSATSLGESAGKQSTGEGGGGGRGLSDRRGRARSHSSEERLGGTGASGRGAPPYVQGHVSQVRATQTRPSDAVPDSTSPHFSLCLLPQSSVCTRACVCVCVTERERFP